MIIFNSDLDNTLIYSYKHDIGLEKICVEIYQNREISFMRPAWIQQLKKIQKKFLFVPTTTRTMEQYKRISMGIEEPEYALVCNGGILLRNGSVDKGWYKTSLEMISDSQKQLEKAAEILEKDVYRCFEVRFMDQLFLFTKSSQPEKSLLYLQEGLDKKLVDVFCNGIKVYVVPKNLDKGTGIIRFKQKMAAERIVAAGDSEFDKPMLLAADVGMCPQGLFPEKIGSIIEFSKDNFTDEMLKITENYK